MAHDIDRKAVAAANPGIDLTKVEEVLAARAKAKEILAFHRAFRAIHAKVKGVLARLRGRRTR